tara:strand:- start:44 stop:472 length:429 start_codon:yes stop_codon:yes gene_type:complete
MSSQYSSSQKKTFSTTFSPDGGVTNSSNAIISYCKTGNVICVSLVNAFTMPIPATGTYSVISCTPRLSGEFANLGESAIFTCSNTTDSLQSGSYMNVSDIGVISFGLREPTGTSNLTINFISSKTYRFTGSKILQIVDNPIM